MKIGMQKKAVGDLPDLPVDREKLTLECIRNLGRKRAAEMLLSVHEAQAIINGLKGEAHHSLEGYPIRGLLAMAENDLCQILGKPVESRCETVAKPLLTQEKLRDRGGRC